VLVVLVELGVLAQPQQALLGVGFRRGRSDFLRRQDQVRCALLESLDPQWQAVPVVREEELDRVPRELGVLIVRLCHLRDRAFSLLERCRDRRDHAVVSVSRSRLLRDPHPLRGQQVRPVNIRQTEPRERTRCWALRRLTRARGQGG